MSTFTDEDVQEGYCRPDAHHWRSQMQPSYLGWVRYCAECGLFDLSDHDKRVRAEALREAASVVFEQSIDGVTGNGYVVDWLYVRADAEEGK